VKEYDIFIPLRLNDGTPIEARRFEELQLRLLEFFNGFTFFPQPNEGYWQMGSTIYRDETDFAPRGDFHRRTRR
jgi:hypothetical protein